ncbi:MAG TPA: PilN domain-containing protein [Pyrinomonadaceae bacterium]|jgi:Tfp pilus assembly protein PilN|nr:PilN domain-containing protein [Pyrinomonadaceae bacterium]
MIKVNLLDSVTDRARSVAVVENRVSDPRTRTWLMLACVCSLTVLAMLFNYVSTNSANAAAKAELERQQQIAAQMAAINKEQADLEKKIKDIQARIDAIKKLRAAQQGPVGVLSAINERLPAVAELRLESIEQKAGDLIIEGHSPNEAAVTQFGRSLEFSSGLFTNVNIETERKDLEISAADYDQSHGPIDLSGPKPETVKFKIKCKYAQPTPPAAAAQQPAPAAAGVPTPQIARR